MSIKVLTVSLALVIFIIVIELIRREKLSFKYAFGWLIVTLVGIVMTLFDQFLFEIAHFFGFELASNFIFFSIISVFVFLALVLTIFLCQQNLRNDAMAQKLGILENDVEELKKEKENVR